MSQSSYNNRASDSLWDAYRDNFSRHLLGVTRYLQGETMNTLRQDCGHQNLRLGFAPYITLIGERGKRLTDLAQVLGISRQACNQAANQIEAAGYIARTADPADGRAKQLVLTERGMRLQSDGLRVIAGISGEFVAVAGRQAIFDAGKTLAKIHRSLSLGPTTNGTGGLTDATLGALLPRVADYTLQRLMELTREKGHPGLKLSFGQVLTLIGPAGGRIQEIARIQHVSKQAISVIATELEELGYLRRDTDPRDARQIVLHFTDRGRGLIADSVASVMELDAEFGAIAGKVAVSRLKTTMRELYGALHLEQEVFGSDIEQLAQQMQQQLGAEGSRALARRLLNPASKQG